MGCCLSLWCLKTCKKMQTGMKIQLFFFFTTTLAISFVVLPAYAVMDYWRFLCWQGGIIVKLCSFTTYTVLGIIERNVFTVIATYRMIAVCFPLKYQQWCQRRVVLSIEIAICFCVVLLWAVAIFTQDLGTVEINDPSSYALGRVLFYLFLLVPIIITVVAYVTMIAYMRFKKGPRNSHRNQVSFGLGILILTNLLLDVPHIMMHLSGVDSMSLPFILIHVIYRLHYALDPFLFVGMNAPYRQKVLRCVSFGRLGTRDVPSLSPAAESNTRADTATAF
ncbi:uncharacterized protein LOC125037271 isoform X2 [Penaeus chinensis]|uniref:uncharacterized protein LOC125037271 isoform X2 n=1 Tax=Penaeus chinensis TaxID=139456 RepID=UPI001FB82119|nr:uncharacterized protein LOC125037271 isoform X2 [Penaeus chinensis]